MRNNNIEDIAVTAVKKLFRKSDEINANFIKENDTEPCWDGHLYITRKQLHDIISIQVKGMTIDKLPSNPSFPIKVPYLINYMRNGGVLFFVVYIIDDDEGTVYFAPLTPLEAFRYLNVSKGHKTINVKLQPIPNPLSELEAVVKDFWLDCKKQTSFDRPILSIKEAQDQGANIFFHDSTIHSEDDLFLKVSRRPHFLYARYNIGNHHVDFPIGNQSYNLYNIRTIKKDVSINGCTFYNHFKVCYKNDKLYINIGKSFYFEINLFNKEVCISYVCGTTFLSEKLYEFDFFLQMLKYKRIMINETYFYTHFVSESDIKKIESEIEYLKRIKEMFHKFNVYDDINLKDLTQKDWDKINHLMKAILDNEPVQHKYNKNIYLTDIIVVARYNFLVILKKVGDYKYKMSNFFERANQLNVSYVDERVNKSLPTSFFTLVFSIPNFTICSNIEYDNIAQSYQNKVKDNPQIYDRANNDMLLALNAYDKMKPKDEKLFDAISTLADWLLGSISEDNDYYNAFKINKYQIVKRKGCLTQKDVEELKNILSKSKHRKDFQVAIYLLLDDNEQAKICFEELPKEKQESFMAMPISYFFK